MHPKAPSAMRKPLKRLLQSIALAALVMGLTPAVADAARAAPAEPVRVAHSVTVSIDAA